MIHVWLDLISSSPFKRWYMCDSKKGECIKRLDDLSNHINESRVIYIRFSTEKLCLVLWSLYIYGILYCVDFLHLICYCFILISWKPYSFCCQHNLLYFFIISNNCSQYPKVLNINSREGLFPDDLRFEGFDECAEYEDDMKGIKELWEYISTTYLSFLQVQNRSCQWILMVEVFIQKWGIDYVPVDIESSFGEVEKEQPIFVAQYNGWIREVEIIRNHHEWIENLNHTFPRVSSYHNYWILRVKAFIQKWSSDYVPDDIKNSLAVVKELYPIDQ